MTAMRAKVLPAMMDARMIDAEATRQRNPLGGERASYTAYLAAHPLSEAVSLILSTQQASGAFGGTDVQRWPEELIWSACS